MKTPQIPAFVVKYFFIPGIEDAPNLRNFVEADVILTAFTDPTSHRTLLSVNVDFRNR